MADQSTCWYWPGSTTKLPPQAAADFERWTKLHGGAYAAAERILFLGGIVGGAVVGDLIHEQLGFPKEESDRIARELDSGEAVAGLLAEAVPAAVFAARLKELGSRPEYFETIRKSEGQTIATARERADQPQSGRSIRHPVQLTSGRAL